MIIVDAGNTAVKWQRYNQGVVVGDGVVSHGSLAKGVSELVVGNVCEPWYVSSVMPLSKESEFKLLLARLNVDVKFIRVVKQCLGLTVAYKRIANLGVDRWLAMLAAREMVPNKSVVVVDVGTAVTVDYVAKDGRHGGGWIAPGLNAIYQGLLNGAQGLVGGERLYGRKVLGVDTAECIANGGVVMLEGFVREAIAVVGRGSVVDSVLITGGGRLNLSESFCQGVGAQQVDGMVFSGMAHLIANQVKESFVS